MLTTRLFLFAPALTTLLACGTTARPPAAPAAPPSAVEALLDDVRRTVLPNGLTVLTRHQPGSGVVAVNTWVKAGYFHEPDEVAGMAHLFEHMFFKGSQRFPGAEQIAQEVSAAGGVSNAGTIYDSTNYYFVLPKEGFRRGVDIQADAILNPLFDPEELAKEAEVVIEESNRKLDNPPAVALERMFATAFERHRIRRWRIGSNEVLRSIRRDDLLAFFATLYRPENIIVTIAGDVPHDEALAAVREAFGALPVGRLDKRRGPEEPEQRGFRFGRSEADITQGYSIFGWPTVEENEPDELVLEVLAAILGGGRSSRLYQAAIGPGAASSVSAFHMTFEDVGIFAVTSSFDEASRAEVDRRVLREVARMSAHGPTAWELALARNALEVETLSGLEDALGQAQALSAAESRGSYRDVGRRLARLAAVSAADVQAAARRYLTSDKLTLYHYQPAGASARTRDTALAAVVLAMEADFEPPDAAPLPDLASSVRPARAGGALEVHALSNGARLVVWPRTGAPLVTTGVFFRGGAGMETPANAGITRLMAAAMRRGTTTRSGPEIDRAIEFLGTQIGSTVEDEYFGLTVDSVTRFHEPALALLADVVLNPTFPADGVEQERHLQLAAIKRAMDSGVQRPLQLYRAAMYGTHPYGLDELGEAESVARLGPGDLRSWWERTVVADGATIVVVGNVDPEDVRRVVEARLGALRRGTAADAAPPVARVPARPELTEERDRKQTAMVVAFPTVPPDHADWPALRLVQSVTSGLGGTFFAELRGRRSLAYTVFAFAEPRARAGSFVAYLATEAAKQEEARTALVNEVRRLRDEGLRAEDVARAKTYLAGSTRIARQTNAALVADLAEKHHLGLGFDFTERLLERTAALDVDALRAVARRYFSGDDFVFAAVRGKPAVP